MNKVNCIRYKVMSGDEQITDGICKADHHQLFTKNLPGWILKGHTVEMRHVSFPKDLSDAANNS